MYTSPIELIYADMQRQMQIQMEGDILKAVQSVGIHVDREELLRALQYDRDQYQKGYEDGKAESRWIPCSDRFPNEDEYLKNDGRFIVTDGCRVYQSVYDIYLTRCFRTLKLFNIGSAWNFEADNCVVAWMPLPEPYKGE